MATARANDGPSRLLEAAVESVQDLEDRKAGIIGSGPVVEAEEASLAEDEEGEELQELGGGAGNPPERASALAATSLGALGLDGTKLTLQWRAHRFDELPGGAKQAVVSNLKILRFDVELHGTAGALLAMNQPNIRAVLLYDDETEVTEVSTKGEPPLLGGQAALGACCCPAAARGSAAGQCRAPLPRVAAASRRVRKKARAGFHNASGGRRMNG